MWEIWKKLFEEVLNKHPPIQQKKIRSKKVPWITSEIKKLINKRDRSKRKAIIKNLEADWLVYKQTRNKVKIEKPKTIITPRELLVKNKIQRRLEKQ
jgi:long-subunit acyl-CoA synthetase (AMP-forming)